MGIYVKLYFGNPEYLNISSNVFITTLQRHQKHHDKDFEVLGMVKIDFWK